MGIEKKSQITIFIIVGLLILVIIGFITILWQPFSVLSPEKEEEYASPLQAFIQECFEETTKSAIEDVSLQGGYFYTPDPALDVQLLVIPYYLDKGKITYPTKQEIAENMALYIETMLRFCTGSFQDIEETTGTITAGEISVTMMLDETIQGTLEYPVTITKEAVTKTLDTPYIIQFTINFNEIYETVEKIMDEQEKTPNALPVGFLTAHASDNNYTFTLSYVDDETVTTTLTFPQYEINQNAYQFVFGMQYNRSSLKVPIDTIELPIPDERCYAGDPCYMNLNIYNESIVFEDMTELFVIDSNGQIYFTPKQGDVGNYTILVHATAENGWEEFLTFELEIRLQPGAGK